MKKTDVLRTEIKTWSLKCGKCGALLSSSPHKPTWPITVTCGCGKVCTYVPKELLSETL